MTDSSEWAGRVAVVTGGGGVLGGCMAQGLARAGARVALLGRTESKLNAVAGRIAETGGEAAVLVANVLEREQLEAANESLHSHWGPADILVNCAGGNMPGATIMPEQSFFDLGVEDFESVVDLNLKGTVLPTLVFGAAMAERGAGNIVNISSMAASRPLTRVVGYSASKAAIDNFTRWLAVEMARRHPDIRVNAIAPGFFVTEQNRRLLTNEDGSPTARGQAVLDHTPAGRFGEPEDLNGVLLWLCGNDARFVTGTVIPVDGGFSAFSGV